MANNSVFSKAKVISNTKAKASEDAAKATAASYSKKKDFDIYGAETYDNYKIDGLKGTVLFKWDSLKRKSPQTKMRISLGDMRDLVNRGYFVWRCSPLTRIYKQKVDQFVNQRLKEMGLL